MTHASLLAFARKPFAPPVTAGPENDRAACVSILITCLLNRAADTGGFLGAIPAHPGISVTVSAMDTDEGTIAELGLGAIATAAAAAITLTGADAARLGFLAVSPLCRTANGHEPDWSFEDPDAAMTASCRIRGLAFEVACINDPGGRATIALDLVG